MSVNFYYLVFCYVGEYMFSLMNLFCFMYPISPSTQLRFDLMYKYL
jgi:hypothetical protein